MLNMYAIKIGKKSTKSLSYPKESVKRRHLYVDEEEEGYTTLSNCKKWSSRSEALNSVTEPWEIVVSISK